MQVLPLGRSSLAQTAAVSLLTLAAVGLFGVVLAYWTWIWLAPRAEPRAEVAAAVTGSLASASLVFGRAERSKNAAAPTGIAIKLLGVAAASGGRRGYAVVQLDAKQILAVLEGEDVTSGVRLAEVHPDQVILERGGMRETLTWPEKKVSASAPPQTAESAAPRAAVVAAPQPAEPVVPRAAVVAAPQPAQPAAPRARGSAGRRHDSDDND
jgi:general secretion pathway protein C